MNLFDDKNKKSRSNKGEIVGGGFQNMIKMRKKKLPELEAEIADMFKDYTGETVFILKVEEDENGESTGHHRFIGGVSPLDHQLKLASALEREADKIRESLVETVSNMKPEQLPEILEELMESVLGDLKKHIKKNRKNND